MATYGHLCETPSSREDGGCWSEVIRSDHTGDVIQASSDVRESLRRGRVSVPVVLGLAPVDLQKAHSLLASWTSAVDF